MNPLRLGIIGMGYTGRQQLAAAAGLAGLEVAAAADIGPIKAPGAEALTLHRDWRALLADGSLDAVSICLPHSLHAEVTLAALAARKHVLLEKPIATDAAEARRVVEAAERAARVLVVEMTHRFYPPVIAGRDLVRDPANRLGRLLAVEDRIVERSVGTVSPWMYDRRAAGGGVALTGGVHMIDRIAYVTGQPVAFVSGDAGWRQGTGDVEDTAAMHLRLADGTPVNLLTAWCTQGRGVDDELTLYGTGGTLRVWSWRGWRFEPADGPPEEHASYSPGDDHFAKVRVGMRGALAELVAAVAEGRTPNPPPRSVLAAQAIIDEFYRVTRDARTAGGRPADA